MTRKRSGRALRERLRRCLRRWLWRALLVAVAFAAVTMVWKAVTWPDVAALADHDPDSTAFMTAYLHSARRAGTEPRLRWQ